MRTQNTDYTEPFDLLFKDVKDSDKEYLGRRVMHLDDGATGTIVRVYNEIIFVVLWDDGNPLIDTHCKGQLIFMK